MEYVIPIIVAIITGGFALLGNYIANRKSAAVMEYRLQQLETKMEKHNQIIERTYRLEESTAIQEEKIKQAYHRIDDLERKMA
jgi:hypothetical protein